jgi:hypothetical protein
VSHETEFVRHKMCSLVWVSHNDAPVRLIGHSAARNIRDELAEGVSVILPF